MQAPIKQFTNIQNASRFSNVQKSNDKLPQICRVINAQNKIFISLQKNSKNIRSCQVSPILPKLNQKQNAKPDLIRQMLQQKKVSIKLQPIDKSQQQSKFGWKVSSGNGNFFEMDKKKKGILWSSLNYSIGHEEKSLQKELKQIPKKKVNKSLMKDRINKNFNTISYVKQKLSKMNSLDENEQTKVDIVNLQLMRVNQQNTHLGMKEQNTNEQIEPKDEAQIDGKIETKYPNYMNEEDGNQNYLQMQISKEDQEVKRLQKKQEIFQEKQVQGQKQEQTQKHKLTYQQQKFNNWIEMNFSGQQNAQQFINKKLIGQTYNMKQSNLQSLEDKQTSSFQPIQNLQSLHLQTNKQAHFEKLKQAGENCLQINASPEQISSLQQRPNRQLYQKIPSNLLQTKNQQKNPSQISNNFEKPLIISQKNSAAHRKSNISLTQSLFHQNKPFTSLILNDSPFKLGQNILFQINPQIQKENPNISDRQYSKILQITKSDWTQTVQEIKNSIKRINFDKSIFSHQVWNQLLSKFQNYYLNKDQKLSLLSLLSKIYNINFGSQEVDDELSFCGEIGLKLHKLQNTIHFKHKQCLQYFKFTTQQLRNQQSQFPVLFPKLNFNMTQDQINNLSLIVQKFCKNNIDAFAFMTLYFQISIDKKLTKNKFTSVQDQIKMQIQYLQKLYPASISQDYNTNQSYGIQSISFSGHFDILKFQQNQKSHYAQLKEFVIKKAEFAKKEQILFIQLVKDSCIQYGYGFKSGLKIRNQNSGSSVFRTIQKILTKKFGKEFQKMKQKRLNNADEKLKQLKNCISEYMSWQKNEVEDQVKNILQKQKIIEFNAKDLVRGKCKFNSIDQILATVKLLKQKIINKESLGIKIWELQNRLNKHTKDVVLLIKLPNSIAELQLALKQDTISNELNHKVYELKRSKIFSCISNLFIQGKKWGQLFFTQQLQIFQQMLSTNPQAQFQQNVSFYQLQSWVIKFKNDFLVPNGIRYRRDQYEKYQQNEKIQIQLSTLDLIIKNGYQDVDIQKREQNKKANDIMFYFKSANNDKALQILSKIGLDELDQKPILLKLKGDVLREKGFVKESIQNYERYVEIQKQTNGQSNDMANVLIKLGDVYSNKGDLHKAHKFYKKCLMIKQKIQGKDSVQVVLTYNKLGNLHRDKGDYPTALQYYQKSLQIIQKNMGKESVDAAQTFGSMGITYYYKGDYSKALQYYLKSLQIYEKSRGKFSIQVAITYNSIGTIYKDKGDKGNIEKALQYYQKCLQIKEKIKGKDSIDVAQVFNNLGILYRKKCDYPKALMYYQKCLQIRSKIKGKNSIDVAETFLNIGNLYNTQGDYPTAMQFLKKCLQIKVRIKGMQSIDVAQVLNSMGVLYWNLRDPKALQYYQKSLQITEKIKGKDCIDVSLTYNNLGIIYDDKGDYAKALQYYQKGLQIEQKIKGKDNIDVASTYYNICIAYYKMKELEKSLNYAKRAYEIWLKVLGPDHKYTKYAKTQYEQIIKKIKINSQEIKKSVPRRSKIVQKIAH